MRLAELAARLTASPDRAVRMLAGRDVVKRTFAQVSADVAVYRGHLAARGLVAGMRVGASPRNVYEWLLLELALLDLGCVSVVLPEEEVAAGVEEIADRYGLHLLLLPAPRLARLERRPAWVGSFEDVADEELRARRSVDPRRELDPDVFTMVFSSGTTGRVKCLLVSRRGTEHQVRCFGSALTFRPDDGILVALPMSVYQQRLMLYTAVWYGFDILLTEPQGIFQALELLRPTILAGPPMLYEAAERRYLSLPPWRRAALAALGDALRYGLWPALRRPAQARFFAPFHRAFGGRTRFLLSGAAASKHSTLDLYERLGLPVYQAYGLTETGFLSWNLPGANRKGSVGRLVEPGTVELAEDGEIIAVLEHPQVVGYFDVDPAEEARTFLGGGRIATGDLGRFDGDGYLYIVGRKKEIIVTQGGYKVHPQTLEREIVQATGAERAVVFGGEDMPGIVVLVVSREGRHERLRALVNQVNRRLPAPSRVARVVFTDEEMTTANGLLNRNLKVDRAAVFERYRSALLDGVEARS